MLKYVGDVNTNAQLPTDLQRRRESTDHIDGYAGCGGAPCADVDSSPRRRGDGGADTASVPPPPTAPPQQDFLPPTTAKTFDDFTLPEG